MIGLLDVAENHARHGADRCAAPRGPRSADAGDAKDVPYVAAVVELEEGVRLATRLTRCAPDALRLGLPVRLAFHDLGEGVMAPWFELVEPTADRTDGQ